MWAIYKTAKTFSCRPSELLAIDDSYAAYCFDSAVGQFGRSLDAELASVEGKNKKELTTKTQRVLGKWLDGEMKFRDPAKSGHVQMPSRDEA